MHPVRHAIATALVALIAVAATGCASSRPSPPASARVTCADLLEAAVAYERAGTGDIDRVLQALSDNCSNEFDIAIDYLANTRSAPSTSCEEILGFGLRRESVELLAEDGHCAFAGAADAAPEPPPMPAPTWPENGLGWDEARHSAGSVQRVCGPLMSVRDTEWGTFVNVGRDYPSTDRFTFVFWDIWLEPIAPGAVICGRGYIELYEGVVAQIEMRDPAALEIWR